MESLRGRRHDLSLYDAEFSGFSEQGLEEISQFQARDTAIDKEKDSIELGLAKLWLKWTCPNLDIYRGSQILNVACGAEDLHPVHPH